MNRPTKAHTRHSADEWRRLVDLQQESGQSQSAFCKARGLGLSTFQYWKKRLLGKAEISASPWLELPVDKSPESGWAIELELGHGIYLRLSRR